MKEGYTRNNAIFVTKDIKFLGLIYKLKADKANKINAFANRETDLKTEAKLNKEFQKIVDRLEGVTDLYESKEYVLGFLIYRHLSESFEAWREKHKDESLDNPDMFDGKDHEVGTYEQIARRNHGYFIKQEYLFSEVLKKASQYEDLQQELMKIFMSIEATNWDIFWVQKPLTSMKLDRSQLGKDVDERNKKIIEIMSAVSLLDLTSFTFGEMYKGVVCGYISLESEGLIPSEVSRLLVELTDVDKQELTTQSCKIYPISFVFRQSLIEEKSCLGFICFKLSEQHEDEDFSYFGALNEEYKNYCEAERNSDRSALAFIYDEEILYSEDHKRLRAKLIERNLLDTVIRLPKKLFKDSIKTRCIVIIKQKSLLNRNPKALFIDASDFCVNTQKMNRLEERGIQKILNHYKIKEKVNNYVCSVSYEDIFQNNYDLSISEYVSGRK